MVVIEIPLFVKLAFKCVCDKCCVFFFFVKFAFFFFNFRKQFLIRRILQKGLVMTT